MRIALIRLHRTMGEQSDATEFSMTSHFLKTQPLEPADRGRSPRQVNMYRVILITLISLIGCGKQDAPADSQKTTTNNRVVGLSTVIEIDDLQELSRKFQRIVNMLASDHNRNERRLELNLTEIQPAEHEPLKQFFIDEIAQLERELKKNYFCTHEEREDALARLRQLDFATDPNIAPRDINEIVAYIEENEFLDTRVLSLRRVDDDTVAVTTGVVRGPLNGGGHVFMARRENGQWIVRHASSWVS